MKFDFNDIVIEPKYLSSVSSRKEIDCTYNQSLPIFVSPMDTVVDVDNYLDYINLGMNVCLPRGIEVPRHKYYNNTVCFQSYGLDDFIKMMSLGASGFDSKYVLIDIANGHMEKLYDTVKEFKSKFKDYILMVGNIANPGTYRQLAEAGADYIRVGIGNGAGCLTTQQTGVGYPMASLIEECFRIKVGSGLSAKIVADGGFKSYSDIIKALALGADYVMLGSILNKTLESSGDIYWKGIKIPKTLGEIMYKHNFKLKKKFRGMSTKEVQRKWGNTILKTSEGVIRYSDVEYTIKKWTDNFQDYLKSTMSYTDCRNLNSFIGKVKYNLISNESYKRFNK